jgi:uncharacterized protein with NRDE domain
MCLILLAWKTQDRFALIVAANRDEFHARAAEPARFWSDQPQILAGRDLEAMGTWMGVARNGRFAAVTNYRGATEPKAAHSRGSLVVDFLNGSVSPDSFLNAVDGKSFSGFNLLACDGRELWWMSNRDGAPRRLAPGVYGLGNLLLDSPDMEAHKTRFNVALAPAPSVEPLFEVLAGARIVDPRYGTRCSTVMLRSKDGRVRYAERSFGQDGADRETLQYEF